MAKTSVKDPVARFIAIVAISIAAIAFFIDYLYVSRDVNAFVVQLNCTFDNLSASIAVTNNGNRQALIINAMAQLMVDTREGRWTIATVANSPDVPAVVDPGKVTLITLLGRIALDKTLSIPTDLDSIRDSILVFAHIVVRSTDGRGIQFAATSPLSKVLITPGQLMTEVNHTPFDVFDHETKITTGLGQFSN